MKLIIITSMALSFLFIAACTEGGGSGGDTSSDEPTISTAGENGGGNISFAAIDQERVNRFFKAYQDTNKLIYANPYIIENAPADDGWEVPASQLRPVPPGAEENPTDDAEPTMTGFDKNPRTDTPPSDAPTNSEQAEEAFAEMSEIIQNQNDPACKPKVDSDLTNIERLFWLIKVGGPSCPAYMSVQSEKTVQMIDDPKYYDAGAKIEFRVQQPSYRDRLEIVELNGSLIVKKQFDGDEFDLEHSEYQYQTDTVTLGGFGGERDKNQQVKVESQYSLNRTLKDSALSEYDGKVTIRATFDDMTIVMQTREFIENDFARYIFTVNGKEVDPEVYSYFLGGPQPSGDEDDSDPSAPNDPGRGDGSDPQPTPAPTPAINPPTTSMYCIIYDEDPRSHVARICARPNESIQVDGSYSDWIVKATTHTSPDHNNTYILTLLATEPDGTSPAQDDARIKATRGTHDGTLFMKGQSFDYRCKIKACNK